MPDLWIRQPYRIFVMLKYYELYQLEENTKFWPERLPKNHFKKEDHGAHGNLEHRFQRDQ